MPQASVFRRLRHNGDIRHEAGAGERERTRETPLMLNLAAILEDTACATPHKTAIAFGDRSWTFKEIDDAARRIASALKAMGVEPGDRIAVSCPHLPEFPMVMFGILKAGAVFTPLNILKDGRTLSAEEAGEILVRGHNVLKRCHNAPQKTAEARGRTPFKHTRVDQKIGRMTSDWLWRELPKEEAP